MPDTDRIPPGADALARKVTRLARKNPADRSVLRHSLGKVPEEAALGVHQIIVPFLPDPPNGRREAEDYQAAERAYYAVAALIAAQPRGARDQADADDPLDTASGQAGSPDETAEAVAPGKPRRRNLGHSLAQAAARGSNSRSLEGHLQLLARQDADGLYRHLPRLILQLRGDQVRIDWGLLIRDLTRWARTPRLVAKEWAQDYYRASERLAADRARKDTGTNDQETDS